MLNTPAQITTGRRLLARFGSWDAVRANSRLVNGVWIVRPDDMAKLRAKAEQIASLYMGSKE